MITFEYVDTRNDDNSAVSKIRMEMPDDLNLKNMVQNYVTFLQAVGFDKISILKYIVNDGME